MLALLALVAIQPVAPQAVTAHPVLSHGPAPVVHGSDTCLPMSLSSGLPTIAGTIDGRAVNFGFDTGSPGGPTVDPTIIDSLRLAKIGEARMTDPSMKNVVTVGLYELHDLRLGNFTIDKWVVSESPKRDSRHLADPDGIIGLDAFAGYIVTIDYPGGRMLLTKGRLPEPDGRTSFRYEGPIPRVPLSIEGRAIDAHVDTGNARYSLIVPENYAAQLSGYANRFPIGVAHTANNKYDLLALPVRDAKIGDMPLYAGTAAFPAPARMGNVGTPILRDMIVKVDPANSIISLERAAPNLENGCPSH